MIPRRLRDSLFALLVIALAIFSTEVPSFADPLPTCGNAVVASASGLTIVDGHCNGTPTTGNRFTSVDFPSGTHLPNGPSGSTLWGEVYQIDNGSSWIVDPGNVGFPTGYGTTSVGTDAGSGHVVTGLAEVADCFSTTNCPGMPPNTPARLITSNASGPVWSLTAPPPTPACTNGHHAAGSYAGTTLAVRLSGVTTPPDGGWRVDAPDPGAVLPTTPNFSFDSAYTVDGSNDTYFDSATVSSLSTLTARITELASNGAAVCYLSITLSRNAIAGTPQPDNNPGTSADAGSGTSCGFSLNPVHYFICLFYPPADATTQWSSRLGTLEAEPPLNVMVGGFSYIHAIYDLCRYNNDIGNCYAQNDSTTFDGPDGHGHADIIGAAANYVQNTEGGAIYYEIFTIALWVGFLWWAWGRISSSFGGRESDT